MAGRPRCWAPAEIEFGAFYWRLFPKFHCNWLPVVLYTRVHRHIIYCIGVFKCFALNECDQPESKTIADNTSINVVEVITADCSPRSIVFDFQSSFAARRTAHQPDIWTSTCSNLNTVFMEKVRTTNCQLRFWHIYCILLKHLSTLNQNLS